MARKEIMSFDVDLSSADKIKNIPVSITELKDGDIMVYDNNEIKFKTIKEKELDPKELLGNIKGGENITIDRTEKDITINTTVPKVEPKDILDKVKGGKNINIEKSNGEYIINNTLDINLDDIDVEINPKDILDKIEGGKDISIERDKNKIIINNTKESEPMITTKDVLDKVLGGNNVNIEREKDNITISADIDVPKLPTIKGGTNIDVDTSVDGEITINNTKEEKPTPNLIAGDNIKLDVLGNDIKISAESSGGGSSPSTQVIGIKANIPIQPTTNECVVLLREGYRDGIISLPSDVPHGFIITFYNCADRNVKIFKKDGTPSPCNIRTGGIAKFIYWMGHYNCVRHQFKGDSTCYGVID